MVDKPTLWVPIKSRTGDRVGHILINSDGSFEGKLTGGSVHEELIISLKYDIASGIEFNTHIPMAHPITKASIPSDMAEAYSDICQRHENGNLT